MRVRIVPFWSDNYAYLLIDDKSGTAAAVDPADPAVVLAAAAEEKVEITHVLTTHSHMDHAGGNSEMVKKIKGLEVIGGKGDGAQACTKEVDQGDSINIGSMVVQVLFTPCHTPGHVCYYVEGSEDSPGVVFTGDTLFVGGCGNFNGGSPKDMYKNLCKKIGKLPADTLVYCGHEYTTTNLTFGTVADPSNKALQEKLKWAVKQRKANKSTMPSTIADEWATNPFMRVEEKIIQEYTGKTDPVECTLAVRQMKDQWGRRSRQ